MRKGLKKILIGSMFALMFTMSAFAQEDEIKLKIEGEYTTEDISIVLEDGKTYIPARIGAIEMGGSVEWIPETKEMILMKNGKDIKITMDNNIAYVNGQEIILDEKPFMKDGNVYIGARFLAESLGFDVNWEDHTSTIIVRKRVEVIEEKQPIVEAPTYSNEELILLAKIVQVESQGLSSEAKTAVANVVLNRVKSPRFPNTLEGVIYQQGQFPPAHKSSFSSLSPKQSCIDAAKSALEGYNNVENCLFFNNRPFKSKSNDLYKNIDGEYFYK